MTRPLPPLTEIREGILQKGASPCAAVITQPWPDLWRADCTCGWVAASPYPDKVLRVLVEHHQRPVDRMDPDVYKVMAEHLRTAVRADAEPTCCPHTPGGIHSLLCPTRVRVSRRHRIAARLVDLVFCPDCLLPRIMPTHWLHR